MKPTTGNHKKRLATRPHGKTGRRQSSPDSIERARAILKGLRVRGTAARLAVLRHMLAAEGPESHSDVAEALQPQGFDSATIYRNLIELAKLGVLSRVDLGDHRWRFEKTAGRRAGRSTHPHFICNDCGSVSCLDDADVTVSSRRGRAKDRVAEVSAITLKGRCRSC
ncbi:MAG: Fur family transcriptional regulator [Candidatus Binataceae bacterium]